MANVNGGQCVYGCVDVGVWTCGWKQSTDVIQSNSRRAAGRE